MWITLLAIASAGDLLITTPGNADVYVDRAAIPSGRDPSQHRANRLSSGMHEIEIRVGRRMVDTLWVEVPVDGRVRVEWATTPAGGVFSVFAPEGQARRPAPPPERPPHQHERPPRGPQPMEQSSFASLHNQVNQASFDSGRIGLLETTVAYNWFTAAQVTGLLKAFDFDSKRVDAACILAPRTIDPQNAHVLGTAFDFSNSRNKALACFR